VLVSALGNPDARSEEFLTGEIGYRIEPTPRLSFDVTAFFSEFDLLIASPQSPQLVMDPFHVLQAYNYANDVSGHTYGTEMLARWQAADCWRLTAGYSWLQTEFDGTTGTGKSNPEHQLQLRSSLELGRGWEFDAAAYFVDRIESLPQGVQNPITIGSYVRLDLGLTWKANDQLEFSLWGQNLLDDGHTEFASYKSPNTAEIPRSFFGKVTWRF
jgi:iron complex outermembrane receptor protein